MVAFAKNILFQAGRDTGLSFFEKNIQFQAGAISDYGYFSKKGSISGRDIGLWFF